MVSPRLFHGLGLVQQGTTIMGFGLIKVKGKTMEFLQLNELHGLELPGALGIGVGDKVLMLENTWYSCNIPIRKEINACIWPLLCPHVN